MRRLVATALPVAVAGLLAGCPAPQPPREPEGPKAAPAPAAMAAEVDPARLAAFSPLPVLVDNPKNPVTDAKVALGKQLYFDARLSKNQDVACNSCHDVTKFGVDHKPTSSGHKGQLGGRNSPTSFNAAGHFAQFWDGRAADVEEQAQGPVTNPVEMAMPDAKSVAAVLSSIPEYVAAFKAVFPEDKDPVTLANAARAIAAFERRLLTPSRWDTFLQGDKAALTAEEKAGLTTFLEAGCQTCHLGSYLGGAMYQKLGLMKPWPDQADLGRYGVTKQDADKLMFKVPSLRNIEQTGPYFHTGKIAALEGAITTMADYQLGKALTDTQVKSIATFLKALTGQVNAELVKAPALPKSTAKTPKPDPT